MNSKYTDMETKKRGRKPRNDKNSFKDAMQAFLKDYQLPSNYSTLISFLRPDIPSQKIYNVKKGMIVDWEILALLKSVSKKIESVKVI